MGSESCRGIKCDEGRRGLQGPRPSALRVSNCSSTMIKKSSRNDIRNRSNNKANNPPPPSRPPVVIYLRSPKIIQVRPEEFMSLVQRLTGKDSTNGSYDNPSSSSPSPSCSRDMQNVGDDDESMKTMTKRDNNLFDADQILGLSPNWLRFLACVYKQ